MRLGWSGRAFAATGALLFGAMVTSCGGGNNTTGGLVATFVPATPNPPALHVTMQAGSAAAQNFSVRIAATDVPDFFGAAFTIDLPAGISFVAMDTSRSFLRDGAFPVDNLLFRDDASTPNTLRVVATRLDAGTYSGVDVAGTRELLTLQFRVNAALPATVLDFTATGTREVRNSVQPPPEGGLIAVTWSGGAVSASQ